MSEGALKKYRNSVNEGGKLIINSDFTESKADNENVLYVPALKLANETGNPKTANMVMLGALAGTIKSVSIENILGALSKKMTNKPELLEINKKAMDIGFELAGK